MQPPYQPPIPYGLTPAPSASNIVMIIFGVLALGLIVEAVRDWRRRGQPLMLVLVVAAVVTNLDEGIADHLGFVWYSDIDQDVWYRSFVPMPLWMVPAYIVFFAGLTTVVMRSIDARVTRKSFVLTAVVCWAVNLAIEVPLMSTGVYTYYGDNQPFSVNGFPLYWLVLNATGPLIAAAVLCRFRAFFTGARLLLVIPLLPMCYAASLGAIGFPIFNLLHSAAPQWAVEVGALITILLGLSVWWFVMELAARDGRFNAYYAPAGSQAQAVEVEPRTHAAA
ncbi:hypothetical protein [Pseudonocardia acidicola]|uniref:Carotenoid biosynthesis protein n=1 Tax=Pseudonocardia acidicola TaxID=2724939 RepID=A0ABX1S9L8_9PSEU|nr:hypothetical protein [Pseudonocardia acidicola]NMH98256.1 hypothetical protein [Pseudonocardia acidicola]